MPDPNPTTRRRDVSYLPGNWERKQTYPNTSVTTHSSSGSWGRRSGTQITVSEGHPWPPPKRRNKLKDIGGNFRTVKNEIEGLERSPHRLRQEVIYSPTERQTDTFVGPIFPISPSDPGFTPFPPTLETSDANLEQLGATAVARCEPTNSVADVSTFLGELYRDGLPALPGSSTWKARTQRAKESGGEFLNVQFGWLPVVSDVKKFAEAVRHADTVLKQVQRDSGKLVRRRYYFPSTHTVSEEDVTSTTGPYMGATFGTSVFMNPPYGRTIVRVREKTQKRWFSGAFTYHLDRNVLNGMDRFARKADLLFGTTLTPEVLWNIGPWSWAVDWFANTGDVISNLSSVAKYGLVMPYGYMMETTIVKDTYTLRENPLKQAITIRPLTFVTITKKRVRAHPFGFGVTWEGLSPLQLAILAALGISRS